MVLGRKPSPMELFMETYLHIDDRQNKVQQLVDSRVQQFYGMLFSTIFLSNYFFESADFFFQDIYNT